MAYEIKPLSCNPSTLKRSPPEKLIVSHYETPSSARGKTTNQKLPSAGIARFCERAGLRDQWPEARRTHREQFH